MQKEKFHIVNGLVTLRVLLVMTVARAANAESNLLRPIGSQ